MTESGTGPAVARLGVRSGRQQRPGRSGKVEGVEVVECGCRGRGAAEARGGREVRGKRSSASVEVAASDGRWQQGKKGPAGARPRAGLRLGQVESRATGKCPYSERHHRCRGWRWWARPSPTRAKVHEKHEAPAGHTPFAHTPVDHQSSDFAQVEFTRVFRVRASESVEPRGRRQAPTAHTPRERPREGGRGETSERERDETGLECGAAARVSSLVTVALGMTRTPANDSGPSRPAGRRPGTGHPAHGEPCQHPSIATRPHRIHHAPVAFWPPCT